MPSHREFIFGPWRAVTVLSITEILSLGFLFCPPVMTVPLIAADHGWSKSFAMAGFSVALLVSGLVSRRVGALIDRFGGHVVMSCGSLIGALGLAGLVLAHNSFTYFLAWAVLGIAISASLFEPAFATLTRIFGAAARSPITALTLAAGFAPTVSWPATHVLIDAIGWRSTYLVYAALLALVAAPLHAFGLPRQRAERAAVVQTPPEHKPQGLAFVLVATAFASYAFVPSALVTHLIATFEHFGLAPATVVAVSMLFGPAQVLARLGELSFGRAVHPLWSARFAVGLLVAAFALLATLHFGGAVAAAFTVMYGMANGLMTVARGTVPLALFGAAGYGQLVGRIARPCMVVQAAAPVALSFVGERATDGVGLALVAVFAVAALLCLGAIRLGGLGVKHGANIVLRSVAEIALKPRTMRVLHALPPYGRRLLERIEGARGVILERLQPRRQLREALAGHILEDVRLDARHRPRLRGRTPQVRWLVHGSGDGAKNEVQLGREPLGVRGLPCVSFAGPARIAA